MTETNIWRPLMDALESWRQRGSHAVFWLRDDDAVAPSAALDRLLELGARFAVPLTLAVVPQKTGAALARRLGQCPGNVVALHGWSHDNHAPTGEKQQELGAHRPADIVLDELASGVRHLSHLHGSRFVAMLVPPWNRIDAALLPRLHEIGLAALSVFGAELPAPIRIINTHVDLIDWRTTRGGRTPTILITEIIARLQQVGTNGGTVGILTHHLVHDDAAWHFLERLFDLTATHPACHWVNATQILATPPKDRV